MLNRACLIVILFAAIPLWSQETNDTEATTTADTDSQMMTPPPVSGASYPSTYAGAERSNYLRAGLSFNTTYTDNISGGTNPLSDISYSVWPTIGLDKSTARLHLTFTYSPGFTLYQKTSSLDQANQSFNVNFQYRLSPHVTLSLRDSVVKTSNVFNQPDPLSATPVPGSAQVPTVAVIAPGADQLNNTGGGTLACQFSRSSMIGIGGTFSNLYYLNQGQVPGLYNSNSAGGSAFYNHRLSKKNYIGVQYQYQRSLAYQSSVQYETQTHSVSMFYTVSLKPALSVSFFGGGQYADIPQPPLPNSHSWSPTAGASFGWQARRTNIASSYSRTISGGGGLIGAFHSNIATASVRQQLARSWNVGAAANYSIYKDVTPFFFLATGGGHSVSGTASVQHTFGEHLSASLGYTRLHQNYGGIALISSAPDTNDEWISLSYQFARPLGR